MFSHRSESEKADLLGEGLVDGATETAGVILEQLNKFDNSIGFRQESATTQFVIETIVFYMHLVDRLAFTHLGAAKRELFGDRFIIAVVKGLLRRMQKEVSADKFGTALRDTYNRRQIEYSRYKVLIPKKDEPSKDTLYWEFSKILFGFLDDTNPTTLIFLNVLVADFTRVVLDDTLKVEKVLRS